MDSGSVIQAEGSFITQQFRHENDLRTSARKVIMRENVRSCCSQIAANHNPGQDAMDSKFSDTVAREGEIHYGVMGRIPKRIGGWLIVVAIGMSLSVLRNLLNCLFSISLLFRQPLWDNLTNPASPAYDTYWKPVLIYESVSNTAIFLLSIIALVLFFQRRKIFPKLIVAVIPTVFVLSLIDYFLAGFIPRVANSAMYTRWGQALIGAFIALHIWIPYFLVSKRVEETFVR